MLRSKRWTLPATLVASLSLFVAACGGDDGGSNDNNTAQSGSGDEQQVAEGKKGGTITYLAAGDVDFVDPGQTYYTFGFMVQNATNKTLYGFKPDDSTTPVPDLAEGEPEVSADKKTVTVKIKKGIKYAPPVDREVKAADVKYAFERAFASNVPSGYAGTYFSSIEGAPEPQSKSVKEIEDGGGISGITTPDDYTIQFKLSEAQAPLITQALVMPITTPVPKEYAEEFDAKNPTEYDTHVAFTGPYMIKNDPETGELTGWKRGRSMEIVRNPNWDAKQDFRPAYLDGTTIEMGNEDLTVASRRALSGQATLCCDAGSPPAPVLRSALSRNKEQVLFVPSGGTRYISFNTTVKPFDNINIRKAIIAASNRDALRQTRGGEVLGDIANGWIPPGIPGFEEAGGLKQNTDLDFLANPEGDPAVAKKYMDLAKADGVPVDDQGKYTGTEEILVIGTNADPGKKTAEVYQNQLEQLGFKLNFRIVSQETLYTKFCGVPDRNVGTCPNVGWFKDFSDPQSMLDATFNGDNILQQGNVNWPELDVKPINEAMTKAALIEPGTERNQAWAKINKMIAEQAPAIPWIWDKTALVGSNDVQQIASGYSTTHDLTFTSLK
jgi:peptide/nickel transport system substrate-binding protein